MFVYQNASRAGLTSPGKIEIIAADDPRHRNYPHPPPNNRATRRAYGMRGMHVGQRTVRKSSRRKPARPAATPAEQVQA